MTSPTTMRIPSIDQARGTSEQERCESIVVRPVAQAGMGKVARRN